MELPKVAAQLGGSGGILPQKSFRFQVLGNAISAILRQRQHVLISHFLNEKCHSFSLKYNKAR